MNDTHSPWNDDVDSPNVGGDVEASDLDAFDVYEPAAVDDEGRSWDSIDPLAVDDVDTEIQTLLFTITNPHGTVSVTAGFDGKVLRIILSSTVTTMTESQLAEEITVLARLAQKRARAGQHMLIVEFMHRLGHDRIATRGFLEYDLGLPSPEAVKSEVAQVFASRYAGGQL